MDKNELLDMERGRFNREWEKWDKCIGGEKTKTCPFCGSPDVIDSEDYGEMNRGYYHVSCLNCGARGPSVKYMSPVEAWNMRSKIIFGDVS